uniref:Uncharacterized protein n=1 Tax=Lotharella globosa TaxID=91324 RepID=A0A7S4DLG6_9EUKA
MGGCCSQRCFGSYVHMCFDLRNPIALDELKDMDILLIRSGVELSGTLIDSRHAAGMHFKIGEVYIEHLQSLPRFDQVGIVMMPEEEGQEDLERTTDNITVVVATQEEVKTMKLQELINASPDIVVRQLQVSNTRAHEEELDEAHTHLDPQSSEGRGGEGQRKLTRPEMLQELCMFLGQASEVKYSITKTDADPLAPMIEFVHKKLASDDIGESEMKAMRRMIHTAGVGNARHGLNFEDILQIFKRMQRTPAIKNTFSEQDVRQMAANMKDTGYISMESFLEAYQVSLKRSVIALKKPMEILTGAFVSLVFQNLHIFPQGAYCDAMEFAQGMRAERIMKNAGLGPERVLVDPERRVVHKSVSAYRSYYGFL